MGLNRSERRAVGKKMADDLDYLNSPASLKEVVQVSRGVAEDMIQQYHQQQSTLHVAMTLQIELLKSIVIKAGLITEEEYRDMYMQKAKEFSEQHNEAVRESRGESGNSMPDMNPSVGDIEIN